MEVPLANSHILHFRNTFWSNAKIYLSFINCLVAQSIVGESHHKSNSYIFRPNFSLALLLKLCTVYLSTAFKNLLISIDRDPRYCTVVVVGHSYISICSRGQWAASAAAVCLGCGMLTYALPDDKGLSRWASSRDYAEIKLYCNLKLMVQLTTQSIAYSSSI